VQLLFKYLPAAYVPALLERGELLFRNLTYFRQCEGRVRGDPYEGIHKDHPGTEREIRNLTNGFVSRGAFSFLHSTDSDQIFAFCLSQRLDARMAKDFGTDAVIEFFDPEELIRRVRFNLRRVLSVHRAGVLAKEVTYYRPDEPALFDVADPKNLAFVKNDQYRPQSEYRLVFGSRKAFKLIQQIAQPHHDPYEDAMQKTPAEKLVRLGTLSDIARVVAIPRPG
jgi:hypothetical protein